MGLVISVEDYATPWLIKKMHDLPLYQEKALKSLGWYMQKEIKKGIESGAPGGKRYKKGMSAKRRRALEYKVKSIGRAKKFFAGLQSSAKPYPWLGRLRSAIGYEFSDKGRSAAVVVGWLSRSAMRLGAIHEAGQKRPIRDATRYRYWAAGVPLGRGKTNIVIPARPTIQPMRDFLTPKVAPYLEAKFRYYLHNEGNIEWGIKASTKKYTVKGAW